MSSFQPSLYFSPKYWRANALGLACLLLSTVVSGFVDGMNYAPIANAQAAPTTRVRYIPNRKRPMPRRTESAGTRGCSFDSETIQVNLLVPATDLPQTQEAHPTFSWHVANPKQFEFALQFSLIEPGQPRPLYQQQVTNRKSGVMQVRLPEQTPGLEVGKQYRWAVSWGCNAQRPSEQIHQRAWIERGQFTPQQLQQLNQAKSEADRIVVYANTGMWYEAISTAANNQADPKIKEYWQTLLEDGKLTQIQESDPSTALTQ